MDGLFVSRPSDLSDLEDILPSLDDVLSPQADFASDSELPLWDSMLSTLSCPGMDSLSNQTMAPSPQEGAHGLEQSSMPGMQAQQPSPSNSACSCDVQHVLNSHPSSQQGSQKSQAKAPQQQQQHQQQQLVRVPDEPTSSRDSNPGVSSPDTAQDKGGSAKKRKMDDSDEDCSGRHPSPASGTSQVLLPHQAHNEQHKAAPGMTVQALSGFTCSWLCLESSLESDILTMPLYNGCHAML